MEEKGSKQSSSGPAASQQRAKTRAGGFGDLPPKKVSASGASSVYRIGEDGVMEPDDTLEILEPDQRGDVETEATAHDPIDGIRGASVDLRDVLGFRWEGGAPYLSINTSSVVKLAAAVARDDNSEWEGKPLVRARHLLRAHLLSTLLGEGGRFGGFVRAADKEGELFSRLIPPPDRTKISAFVQAASDEAVGHWEAVEILAAASAFRRDTNKAFRDIGQRHLFAALFSTKVGQTAFRDLGGFASGYEALRSGVLACLKVDESTAYDDDAQAWRTIIAELAAAAPLVDRVERRPDYLNDRVTTSAGLGQEPLGAAEDAQALADLILLEAAEPPIAVGLFGPWGSGKSTLIEHLKTEVVNQTGRERARRAAMAKEDDRLRIVANVVQLSFNAWTFADSTNLWATFTSEIFDQLAAGGAAMADDRPAGEGKDLQTRVAAAALVSEVAARTAGEVASLRVADIAVQQQDRAIEVAEELLEKARADRSVAFGDGVIDAAKELGQEPGEIASALDLIRANYQLGWKRPLAIVLALLAVAAGLYLLPSRPLIPPSAIEWLSAASVLVGFLWPGVRAIFSAWRHWRIRRSAARRAVADANAELRQHRELRAAAERDRDRSKAFLNSYAMDEHGSAATSPMQMLDYLLKESKSVAAVRAQTGLLAVVRRCFEQLEMVIANARRERAGAIDRIILYIDDLDRCSTKQVSEILQAVHLLLSFNCFIVVVAADANWLKHSLEDQHPQLFDDKSGRLTPADYLEKIFQIPFWVRPLVDADARADTKYAPYHSYVDFLLKEKEPSEAGSAGLPGVTSDKPSGEGAGTAGGSFTSQSPNREDDPAPPRRERMTLTTEEQAFLKTLGALAAKSPRAVKRLINTYRLFRVRLDGPALALFLGDGNVEAAAYRAVLFAMACEVGLPPATMTLVGSTIMAMSDDHWTDFIGRMQNPLDVPPPPANASGQAVGPPETVAERLVGALRSANRLEDFKHSLPPGVPGLTLRQLQMGLEEVRRYSFRPL